MKINNKSEEGGTLALVLVIMLVLTILGYSLLSVSVAEATFSARQVNTSQAYFSARSGVEIGLKNVVDILNSGAHNTVASLYSAVSATTLTGSVNTGEDSYSVTYVDGGLVANNQIKILATGTQNNTTATTALTIRFATPSLMPSGWLNPGQIIKKGFFEMTTEPLIVNNVKSLGHAAKKSTQGSTTWRAPSIHFVDNDMGYSVQITAKQLEVQTNLMSFFHKIYTDHKTSDDSLVFNTFNSDGFFNSTNKVKDESDEVPDGWGVVVLKEAMIETNSTVWADGYYAVAPGTQLTNSVHRDSTSYVRLITNSNTKKYIEQVIKEETKLSFDTLSKKWSNN